MNRRDLIKLAGLAGLTAMTPSVFSRSAHAQEGTWNGPYLLHMHALGGWDPTILCDAKVTASSGTTPLYQNNIVSEIDVVNGIPVPSVARAGGQFYLKQRNYDTLSIESPKHFFERFGDRILVLNGIDTQTNNHATGNQGANCGHNSVELPALAALYAGYVVAQRPVPLAFLGHGNYNRTGNVVAISRFPGSKAGVLASPFQYNAGNPLVSDVAASRISELRLKRVRALQQQEHLPRAQRTLAAMAAATEGGATLALLQRFSSSADAPVLDELIQSYPSDCRDFLGTTTSNGRRPLIGLASQIEVALRCFKEGLSVSSTFAQGGFDTHSSHDLNQSQELGLFLARLRYALLRIDQLGLRDKTYVLVTSEFARTPLYNGGAGKDHWNINSALLIGPGIRGGRVLGGTTAGQHALPVRPDNPSVTLEPDDRSGTRILPWHIHAELRRVLGINNAPFIQRFPLPISGAVPPLLG